MNPAERINNFPDEEMLPTKPKPTISKTEIFIVLTIAILYGLISTSFCSPYDTADNCHSYSYYGISSPSVNFKVSP